MPKEKRRSQIVRLRAPSESALFVVMLLQQILVVTYSIEHVGTWLSWSAAAHLLPLIALILFTLYYFSRPLFLDTTMDTQTFFAGMQALAAFLQIWQTERNARLASKAYFETKRDAMASIEVKQRAAQFDATLRRNPVLGRLLENRFGRCEDEFEKALRREREEELDAAAKAFVRCKCLILQAIKTAQAGLEEDLQAEWDKYGCEVVLAKKG